MHRSEDGGQFVTWPKLPVQPATSPTRPDIVSGHTLMAGTESRRPMGPRQGPGPWAGVLLSDEEAMQIIAVLADVLDGHDVGDAVSAAWSLLGNRLGAQAGIADPALSTWPASTGGWPIGPARGTNADGCPSCHLPLDQRGHGQPMGRNSGREPASSSLACRSPAALG